MNALAVLDYAGIAVFAATGALAGSRKQLDIVGFIFLATVTGIGGGTVRDLILGVPVFWVRNPDYVVVTALVAIVVFFTAHRLESRYRVLLWLDAIGLAAYATVGAAKGLIVTGSGTVAITTGVLTACLGGILRDLFAGEPSVLLRPEIYVTAAITGAAAYTVLAILGVPAGLAALVAVAAALIVRGGALAFGWRMVAYKGRPGRSTGS